MTDKDHLIWIYHRMLNIHGEKERTDYMIRFRKIIDSIPEPTLTHSVDHARTRNDYPFITDMQVPNLNSELAIILKDRRINSDNNQVYNYLLEFNPQEFAGTGLVTSIRLLNEIGWRKLQGTYPENADAIVEAIRRAVSRVNTWSNTYKEEGQHP